MPSAPLRLRCEFVQNPLGVDVINPRLSWWVNDARPAEIQSAYEILVSSSPALLRQDEGDLWRSGLVESNQTLHVQYQGARLAAGLRAWWKVRTYDSDGLASSWSEPADFEMGLLSEQQWPGPWIAGGLHGSFSRGVHAVCLRRDFLLTEPIRSARLYIAVAGDYRLFVNGAAISQPGSHASWSQFPDTVYYRSHDVTAQLLAEPNAIGVLLSDGYFAGELPGLGRARYGTRPLLRLRLVATLANGARVDISSDEQWRWAPSHLLAADINVGEHSDARLLQPGWSEPGFDDASWQAVDVVPFPATLKSLPHPQFGVQQALRPMTEPFTTERSGRAWAVFDFGEQIVGRVCLSLLCRQSDALVLSYSLDKTFADATTDTHTTPNQAASHEYEGQFALHAFRFLKVEFTPTLTEVSLATALRIGAPEASAISVRSDHPSLNQLFEVIDNSFKSVAFSAPMRGAASTQRLPDIGYAGTWMPFFAQQDRSQALIIKWLNDALQKLTQGLGGPLVPALNAAQDVLPHDEFAEFECLVATVWQLYRYQNDVQTLQHCYPQLRAMALSYRHANTHLLRPPSQTNLYGEGLESALVATATVVGALRCMARIASVLSELSDQELLQTLVADVRKAFRQRYITGDGHLACDTESAYVSALHHGLLEDIEQQRAEQRLVEIMQSQHYHSKAAPLVLPHVLPVLTHAGRLDIAYMVLLQTSAPSWLAAIQAGDRLVARVPGSPDLASVGVLTWLIESLVGVRLQDDFSQHRNGYRAVTVRPMPPLGKQFLAGAPVQFIEASLRTPMGRFEISWWIKDDRFELELLIPTGCEALVIMPDDIEQTVQSGHHRFLMDFQAGGDGVPTLLELVGGRQT